jgi:hypothetical protein
MRILWVILAAAALSAASASPGWAQRRADLKGTISAIDSGAASERSGTGTVLLVRDGHAEGIAGVRALDVRDGRRFSTWQYTRAGALAGAVVGMGAYYFIEVRGSGCGGEVMFCELGFPLAALYGAVPGGAIGFVVGKAVN